MLEPEVVGWRRENVPVKPREFPVRDRQDWVRKVCQSTRRKDRTIVAQTLADAGVPSYWFPDVDAENLQVFALHEGKYVLTHSLFREDVRVRIPPFDAVELSLPELLGDGPED